MGIRKDGLSLPRPAHLWGLQSDFRVISESSSLSSEGRRSKMSQWVRGLREGSSTPASTQDSCSDTEKMSSDESSAGMLSAGEQDEQCELPSGVKLALIVFALCMSILVMSLGIYRPLPFRFPTPLAPPLSCPSYPISPSTSPPR